MIEDNKNEFKTEIKIWYGSNYHTFLDSVITKYHANSTHLKQICVPINGHQWSILDVKVNIFDMLKVLGETGFVQQIIFQDLKKRTPLSIWMPLRIKVYFLQFGGLNILVCTLVRIG